MTTVQEISTNDLIAEVASLHGQPKILAGYLRSSTRPNHLILKNIASHLRGTAADWKLIITTRNGRPPKFHPVEESLLVPGQEKFLGDWLWHISTGEAPDEVERSFIQLLAEAIDPNPKSKLKWKLVYKRPKVGNPDTPHKTSAKKAILGLRALILYRQLGNWRAVDDHLHSAGLASADGTSRRKAVQMIRKLKPLE